MPTAEFPKEALREKLVVAGIPRSEHDVSSLMAKIADFQAPSFREMSADMVAELLLYLIAKGFITLPFASDKVLLDLPWGSHVCQFYNDKEDLLEMLVPYFKQGLERNEACVWLVGDLTIDEARTALEAAVPDLNKYLATGQMQIRHYTDLYTNADGTVKPATELSEAFAAMGSSVQVQGFTGLRASGSVSWVDGEDNMARFMDYETKVNLAIQNARIMAVCTYPSRAAAHGRCRELIHNHGNIFVKRGAWVHDNSKEAKKIEEVFASLAAR